MNVKTATYGKRILCMFAALIMLCAMAVPAFADWHIELDAYNSSKYINIAGTLGTSPDRRYLTLYTTSSPNMDQTFRLMRKAGTETGNNYVLCASQNTLYAVNRTSGNRAWMWNLSNNGYGDSRLKTPVSDPNRVLVSYSYGAIGANGSNIYFGYETPWIVEGTPTLPLSSSPYPVPVNAYI